MKKYFYCVFFVLLLLTGQAKAIEEELDPIYFDKENNVIYGETKKDYVYALDNFLEEEEDLLLLEEEEAAPEEQETTVKLDYSLKTMEERSAHVEKLIAATPPKDLTPKYLEILGDYIMDAIPKEDKKEHNVLTKNRMVTVNKRETSFEELASKFENGEDGIYNLITEDKNILFTPKISITQADIDEIPGLKELRECIDEIEAQAKAATGKKKFLLKKQVIEMRRDQYVLKNAYRAPMAPVASPRGSNKITLDERKWVDENGEPQSDGLITFFDPKHISAILCNYNALKISLQGKF